MPGVGEELAHRLHADLGVETLEELEVVAHDGRLESVPGFGPGRARMVRDGLAGILARSAERRARRRNTRRAPAPVPPVDLLLALDADYRRQAEAGELTTIAPRRFNPDAEAWLPIWHPRRGGFSFTAQYSNTARAHELGHTHDWVVIHFERDGREGQATVVTETHGPLRGQRVVRGREEQCAAATIPTADRSVAGGSP
ncbi:MAG: helix-hairpin-helix domain-containing protein [Planctomycetota bacterium]